MGSRLAGLLYSLAGFALDCFHVDFVEFFNEQFAIFRVHDGLYGSTEHLDAVFFQHTALIKLHSAIKRRLTAKSQKNAIRTLFLNDTLNEIWLNGQEINLIGNPFGCLHSGNIRIDEHCINAFLA